MTNKPFEFSRADRQARKETFLLGRARQLQVFLDLPMLIGGVLRLTEIHFLNFHNWMVQKHVLRVFLCPTVKVIVKLHRITIRNAKKLLIFTSFSFLQPTYLFWKNCSFSSRKCRSKCEHCSEILSSTVILSLTL